MKYSAAAEVATLAAPACAALIALDGPGLATTGRTTFDLAIYNELFPQAQAFAAGLSGRGAPVLAVQGDAGRLWYDTLRGLVNSGARRIAGMTTHADLLILETLARDKGLRIRRRHNVGGARLVSWMLL